MRKLSILILVIILTAVSCHSTSVETQEASDLSIPSGDVESLLCGAQTDCLAIVCEDPEKCPVKIALSDKAIYDFVKTYSECEGCNTPEFPPDQGIGKCIEYETKDESPGWRVKLWVSENCNFRYSDPTQASLSASINSMTFTLQDVTPAVEYIKNPLYCEVDKDCKCLSGSGLPSIGCSNFLYAPLNGSGYFSGGDCTCNVNQCVQKP
jgi:hypothetical protein